MRPIRLGARLEVPLEYLHMDIIEKDLTVENKAATKARELGFWGRGKTASVSLYWLDSAGYVNLPRSYTDLPLTPEGDAAVSSGSFENLAPSPEPAEWRFRRKLREAQIPVANALLANEEKDKLLCLSCGAGKTTLALWYAAQRCTHTLIIVDSDFLADQWQSQINKCLWVDKKKIGLIKGETFEDKPITVALLQTLWRRIDSLPQEFFDKWGLIIYDECHVMSAPHASRVLPQFPGWRLGLSATPKRQDGLEPIFLWHLGGLKPFYVDLSKPKAATWCFKRIPRAVSEQDEALCWRRVSGKTRRDGSPVYALQRSRFDSFASKDRRWNEIIIADVLDAVRAGRQSIVLGTRVEQLRDLCKTAQDKGVKAGLVVGSVKGDERKETLAKREVIFATAQLANKALDVPRLDTLFVLYPTTDQNFLRQASGRISRICEGKKDPVVVIYSHAYNSRLERRETEMSEAIRAVDPGAYVHAVRSHG